jgi:hypothetical protein
MFPPQGGGSLEPQSRTDSNNNDMTFPSVETLPHWRHEQRHDVSSSNWRQSHTPIPDQLQQQQHDVPFCREPSYTSVPSWTGQHHYPCEIDCRLGFADTAHRLLHYAEKNCVSRALSTTRCHDPGCTWVSNAKAYKPTSRAGYFLKHYVHAHAPEAYQSGYFQNGACQLGFGDNLTFFYQRLGGAGVNGVLHSHVKCPHRNAVLRAFSADHNIDTDGWSNFPTRASIFHCRGHSIAFEYHKITEAWVHQKCDSIVSRSEGAHLVYNEAPTIGSQLEPRDLHT